MLVLHASVGALDNSRTRELTITFLLLASVALAHEPPTEMPPPAALPTHGIQPRSPTELPAGIALLGHSPQRAPDWQIVVAGPAGIAMPFGWHQVPSWGETRLHLSGAGVGLPEVDEQGEPLELGIFVEVLDEQGSLDRLSKRFRRSLRSSGEQRVVLSHEVVSTTICGDSEAQVHSLRLQEAGRSAAYQRLLVVDEAGEAWAATSFVTAGLDSSLTAADSPLVSFLEPWLMSFCPKLERIDTSALDLTWAQQQEAPR